MTDCNSYCIIIVYIKLTINKVDYIMGRTERKIGVLLSEFINGNGDDVSQLVDFAFTKTRHYAQMKIH